MTASSLHALLHTAIDYAGLFPPASLSMETAVAHYASYRRDPHSWMLGRFVVPVARLDEMADAVRALGDGADGRHWRLSALVGEDVAGELTRVADFNRAARGALVDAVEVKADGGESIARAARAAPREVRVYVEIAAADPRAAIAAVAAHRLRAKIRTGGVVPEAFPSVEQVARFVQECYAAGVGFKATAGLHHPLRSERALTYAPDAPRGTMHGFLNLLLAAAFQYNGLTRADAREILEMPTLAGVAIADDGIAWKDYRVSLREIETVRRRFAAAFGSCSFREPVDDLVRLGLLS